MEEVSEWAVETVCQVALTGVLIRDEDGNQQLQLWTDSGDKIAVIENQGAIDDILVRVV